MIIALLAGIPIAGNDRQRSRPKVPVELALDSPDPVIYKAVLGIEILIPRVANALAIAAERQDRIGITLALLSEIIALNVDGEIVGRLPQRL